MFEGGGSFVEKTKEIQERLEQASHFVVGGVEQILSGKLDEMHGVSPSPGATALAALALLAVGRGFENTQRSWIKE